MIATRLLNGATFSTSPTVIGPASMGARMPPALTTQMSAWVYSRYRSQTRLPRFVSRLRTLSRSPSSGTVVVATTSARRVES